MKHLYLFYFFTTFSVGIVSLTILALIYLKTRDVLLRYYLYFYSVFTVISMLNVLLFYVRVNSTSINPSIMSTIDYIEVFVSRYVLMFVLLVFVHYLFSVPHAKRKNVIWASVLMFLSLANHSIKFVIAYGKLAAIGRLIENIMQEAVLLYVLISGLYFYNKLEELAKKRFALKFLVLEGLCLLISVNDTILSELSWFRFWPLLYWAFSIILTHHFIKQHLPQFHSSASLLPAEEIFQKYRISPREQEVTELILQGYSNTKIAETLFISLHTAKKHVRNIYAKFGVNSRYELITFFKNTTNTDSPNPE